MSNNYYQKMLLLCRRAKAIGLYGFIIFLPCSIAFAQMGLILLALAYFVEAGLTRTFSFPQTPLNHPLGAYIMLTLATTLFSINIAKSVKETQSLLVIATFYLIYASIEHVAQIKTMIKVLLICMTLAALYGILQHFLEVDLFRLSRPISFLKHVNDDLKAPVRVPGFFSSYMTFSGQLSMTVPILCVLILSATTIYKKGLGLASLFLTSLALLWTYTRSAWIGTVCALMMIGYVMGKRLFTLVLIFLIFFGGTIIVQPKILDRSLSVFSAKENRERLYTWESTLHMIADYPLTGIGKGNYAKLTPEYRQKYGDFPFTSKAHAHNNILQVMVDGGLVSGFCFLWLWVVIFRELYRTYQRMSASEVALKWLSLGFLGALVAFFVQGFFENTFGDSESVMMMWMLAACALKLQHISNNAAQS